MPQLTKSIPKYRKHRASGQAIVTLSGKDFYLGPWPTLPHLSLVVANMVRLQQLTGMRPNEVCIVRPCDVDRSTEVWSYRPTSHKTEHHGRDRVIFIGPQGQAILRPYLLRAGEAHCFSPLESEGKRKAEMREKK